MPSVAVVLAAGMGTRMKSALPKVLHPVAGKPMLLHVMDALKEAGVEEIIVVLGHGADLVEKVLGDRASVVIKRSSWARAMPCCRRCRSFWPMGKGIAWWSAATRRF